MTAHPKVVVGIDGSAASEVALDWAAIRAQQRGVPLEVVHAWHVPVTAVPDGWTYFVSPAEAEVSAKNVLEDTVEAARTRDVAMPASVKTRLVNGDAAGALVAAAVAGDELVVGSHGHGLLRRVILGSVAERVLHEATTPVTIVPADYVRAKGSDRILVGVDGSATSGEALSFAVDLANQTGMPLEVLSVYPVVGEQPRDHMRRDALAVIDQMLDRAADRGHPCPAGTIREVAAGFAAARLLEASADAANLVVGYSGAAEHPWRLGSVSRRCVYEAHRPVTVVKSP